MRILEKVKQNYLNQIISIKNPSKLMDINKIEILPMIMLILSFLIDFLSNSFNLYLYSLSYSSSSLT